jgi:proline iminopeptidase
MLPRDGCRGKIRSGKAMICMMTAKPVAQVLLGITVLVWSCTCRHSLEKDISESVILNGIKLNYHIEGQGIPCIVYGFPKLYQRAFSKNLRDHIRFIFAETRMCVPTDTMIDWKKVTLDALVDEIDQIREALHLRTILIFGHSSFGIIAAEYARKYPDHTAGVIMSGTEPCTPKNAAELYAKFWDSTASEERKRIYADKWKNNPIDKFKDLPPSERFIKRLINEGPKEFYDARFDCSTLFEGCTWNFDGINQYFGAILPGYDMTNGRTIKTPIFLASGKYDYYCLPYTLWDERVGQFPDFTQVVFEKSGHYPMYEEPSTFDKSLLDWLKKH